jgi:tRNA(Arg) A34 adenosine deaminase TadA
MKHSKFMKEAILLSNKSVLHTQGGPFGCVVVKAGKIVGKGTNQVTPMLDPTAHAEIVAIRDACNNLKTFTLNGCTLYTSCEPCPMCLSAMYWSRIKTFYYGNTRQDAADIGFDDALIYKEISRPITKRKIVGKSLLQKEATIAFENWHTKADRVNY